MENQTQTRSIGELQQRGAAGSVGQVANMPLVEPGFNSLQGYELLLRQANALGSSTLVPPAYRKVIVKYDKDGNQKGDAIENANAIPNCMIALNMATRMRADPLMVMQNLYIVEGRPSWSSQWAIAQVNQCGRFEPLRFDLKELGEQTVPYEITEWNDTPNGRRPTKKRMEMKVQNVECVAWTVRRGTAIPSGVQTMADAIKAGLPVLKGPKVSIDMAIKEGWFTKNGSKWQTMPELMLHYRSGTFFARLYAPELLMGIPSADEIQDMGVLSQGADGSYSPAPTVGDGGDASNPSVESLRRTANANNVTDADPGASAQAAGAAEGAQADAAQGASTAAGEQQKPEPQKADDQQEKPAPKTADAKPAQPQTAGDDMFTSAD